MTQRDLCDFVADYASDDPAAEEEEELKDFVRQMLIPLPGAPRRGMP
jgi:hypothetical protein